MTPYHLIFVKIHSCQHCDDAGVNESDGNAEGVVAAVMMIMVAEFVIVLLVVVSGGQELQPVTINVLAAVSVIILVFIKFNVAINCH